MVTPPPHRFLYPHHLPSTPIHPTDGLNNSHPSNTTLCPILLKPLDIVLPISGPSSRIFMGFNRDSSCIKRSGWCSRLNLPRPGHPRSGWGSGE
jgi:hypothetical protein